MTDFHSHILPEMDDGSRSVEESLEMLGMLSQQGIERVVATPHFYANDESVPDFLERRQRSLEKLSESLRGETPQIVSGAEIRYYEGISRLEGLSSLRVRDTELLLIEMPERRWSDYTVRELTDISSSRVTPVIAHIERCIFFQSEAVFFELLENGVLMQMNAGFVNGVFSRSKALKLFKKNQVHFLGSDCHNTRERAPDIGKAIITLEKKLGKNYMSGFEKYANDFFKIKAML